MSKACRAPPSASGRGSEGNRGRVLVGSTTPTSSPVHLVRKEPERRYPYCAAMTPHAITSTTSSRAACCVLGQTPGPRKSRAKAPTALTGSAGCKDPQGLAHWRFHSGPADGLESGKRRGFPPLMASWTNWGPAVGGGD